MPQLDPNLNDWYRFIEDKLGADAWIPIFIDDKIPATGDDFFLYSAL